LNDFIAVWAQFSFNEPINKKHSFFEFQFVLTRLTFENTRNSGVKQALEMNNANFAYAV